jgi:hypothetical protein
MKVTLAARVSLSPDSPTQIFKHSFLILTSRITFFEASLGSFFVFLAVAFAGVFFTSCEMQNIVIDTKYMDKENKFNAVFKEG